MPMPLPKLTSEGLKNGILEMCGHAVEMLRLSREAFQQYSAATLQDLSDVGRHLHHHEKRLTDHVAMQLREHPMSLRAAEHLAFLPAALERIGDSVEALGRCVAALHRDDIPFSERGQLEILSLMVHLTMVERSTLHTQPALIRCVNSWEMWRTPMVEVYWFIFSMARSTNQ